MPLQWNDLATQSPEAKPDNTTLLVLCGGAGSRMNGQDKPLLSWQHQPMVCHVLASVPAAMPKLISANRNLDIYQQWAAVVPDITDTPEHNNRNGPLTGILSGMRVCSTPWLLVCPGDTPNLPQHWGERMLAAANSSFDGAVAHDEQRQQHLHVLLRQSLMGNLEKFIGQGGFAAHRWLHSLNLAVVRFSGSNPFPNINTPEDLCD